MLHPAEHQQLSAAHSRTVSGDTAADDAGACDYDVKSYDITLLALQSTSLASPTPSEEGAEEVQSHAWGSSAGGMAVLTNGALHDPNPQQFPP